MVCSNPQVIPLKTELIGGSTSHLSVYQLLKIHNWISSLPNLYTGGESVRCNHTPFENKQAILICHFDSAVTFYLNCDYQSGEFTSFTILNVYIHYEFIPCALSSTINLRLEIHFLPWSFAPMGPLPRHCLYLAGDLVGFAPQPFK